MISLFINKMPKDCSRIPHKMALLSTVFFGSSYSLAHEHSRVLTVAAREQLIQMCAPRLRQCTNVWTDIYYWTVPRDKFPEELFIAKRRFIWRFIAFVTTWLSQVSTDISDKLIADINVWSSSQFYIMFNKTMRIYSVKNLLPQQVAGLYHRRTHLNQVLKLKWKKKRTLNQLHSNK